MALSYHNIIYDLYDYIDSFAPFNTQDSFDNSGLLVGSADDPVTKAAVCLDITNEVVEEAHRKGAELIISHHPVIFNKPSSIGRASPVYRLIKYEIGALCVHTPLDMAKGGISDMMYRLLELPEPDSARVLHVVHHSGEIGYGKVAVLKQPAYAAELAGRAKKAFGCTSVRYVDSGRDIYVVAVCSGAGNDEIYSCIENDVDALITGDVKWHGFVDALNAGLTVIDAGHFHTEFIVCKPLMEKLRKRFPTIEFFIPDAARDICEYC